MLMKQHVQLWKPPMANINLISHTILLKADVLKSLLWTKFIFKNKSKIYYFINALTFNTFKKNLNNFFLSLNCGVFFLAN